MCTTPQRSESLLRSILSTTAALALAFAVPGLAAQEVSLVGGPGQQVEIVRAGEAGPSVVVVPGGFQDWRPWSELVARMGRDFRVLSYAGPGVSRSSVEDQVFTPDRAVSHLHELLAVVGLPPPYVLVGHSAGGLIIRAFAARYPNLVAARLYVDPSVQGMMAQFDRLEPGYSEREWEAFFAPMEGTDQDQLFERARAFWAASSGTDYQVDPGMEPDVPTIVLTSVLAQDGSDDLLDSEVGREAWKVLHASLLNGATRGAQFMLADAGHSIHLDEPDVILQALSLLADWIE